MRLLARLPLVLLRTYIYASSALILITLTHLSSRMMSSICLFTGPVLVLYAVLLYQRRKDIRDTFLLSWFGGLILWFLLQQGGIAAGLPFFTVPPNWPAWYEMFSLFFCGAVYFLVTKEVLSTRVELNRFIRFFITVSTIMAVYFIYLFYAFGVNVNAMNGPFPILHYLGEWAPFSVQPNDLIDLFIPAFFLCVSYILYHYRRKLNHPEPGRVYSEMMLFLCFACVLLAAILFTKSRAGIVAFLASLGCFCALFTFVHRRRRGVFKLVMLILGVGFVFLLSLGLGDVLKELLSISKSLAEEVQSLGLRTATIGASWQLVAAKGFTGVGLGNFQMGWLLYKEPPYLIYPPRSYNDFLWFWAEAGFPGALLLGGAFFVFFFSSIATAFKTKSCFISYFASACVAIFSAYAAHSLVDTTFYVPSLFWLICIMMGLAGSLRYLEIVETAGEKKMVLSRGLGKEKIFVLLFILVACGISGVSFRQLAAASCAGKNSNIEGLKKASNLDRFSGFYDRQRAYLELEHYRAEGDKNALDRAAEAMDEVIHRNPMNPAYLRMKAEILFEGRRFKEVYEVFEKANDRLPDFYLLHLEATAFYLESSLVIADEDLSARFRARALRHYNEALKLSPDVSRRNEMYHALSKEGREELRKILDS